jgi:predicted  nucleic acid-binding Zn-ribbon protein
MSQSLGAEKEEVLSFVLEEATDTTHYCPANGLFTAGLLVQRVMSSLGPQRRKRIPQEIVEEAVSALDLLKVQPRIPSPRLRVEHLTFSGEKRLTDSDLQPFRYVQRFPPGVNVVLIPDNDVGKSSILKTIKYGLTGDDSDFDMDVKSWIQKLWLQFSLDGTTFTVHIAREPDGPQAYLAIGAEERGLDDLPSIAGVMETVTGADEIREMLNRFFFQRLGLGHVGWTQGTERRYASWRTFFQALLIPDSSDRYLICDPQHSFGAQDNLIVSVFLGLSYTEAINQLLIERQTAKKETDTSKEQVDQAQAQAEVIDRELQEIRQKLLRLDHELKARRVAVQADASTQRLAALQSNGLETVTQLRHLEEERERLGQQIRRGRARAKNLREAIQMQLHFTGLDVHLCPNCDADVDEDAVRREQDQHCCRLCGKQPSTTSAADIEAMETEAEALQDQVGSDERARDDLSREIDRLRGKIRQISHEATLLEGAARRGVDFALPTPQEEEERMTLLERTAELRVQLLQVTRRIGESTSTGEQSGLRAEVQDIVRNTLRQVAEEHNRGVLASLAILTQEMARAFGAQSVTDVTCSAVGSLSLKKNGVKVAFKSINNPGERLRVKLGFFLALMRLGRLSGANAGRHPGFLLIDQPASAEMVTEDVAEVVRALCQVDCEHAEHLQIICFTARSEFAQATASGKVYGPQAGQYAF